MPARMLGTTQGLFRCQLEHALRKAASVAQAESRRSLRAKCQAENWQSDSQEIFRRVCAEQGIRVVKAEEDGDEEDWEDVQEDMEDFWMRDPQELSGFDVMNIERESSAGDVHVEPAEVRLADLKGIEAPLMTCILDVSTNGDATPSANAEGDVRSQHIPLKQLSREAAESLRKYHVVAVVGDDSAQALQAYTRLHRVFGIKTVRLLQPPQPPQST